MGIKLPQDEEQSAFGGAIYPSPARDKDGGSADKAEGFVDEEGGDDVPVDESITNPIE